MRTEIIINGNANPDANYITWAPIRCQIRLAEADGATTPVRVRLKNQATNRGGQVVFFAATPETAQDELQLNLPANGSPVQFSIAGKFQRPSVADKDAVIEVSATTGGTVLSLTPLMVRIRKNANTLTTGERNRFLTALARLNDRGMGRFSDFRNIHTNAGSPEAHGNAGFLPWHRAFMLDLERELQAIDPSVTLPYWRFDEAAPRLFTRDFMGVADQFVGRVQFSATNPLQFWTTDQSQGIVRPPRFDTARNAANNGSVAVLSEAATLLLGTSTNMYELFRRLEGQPHGLAHTSFGGFIASIPTAAKDPLFFLLHANIDRLWAKWQWLNRRFDIANTSSYPFLGSAGAVGATRVGHNLNDTMWPWNQVTGSPRPPTAPGGNFPPSPTTSAPGLRPTVRDMIDYQGVITPSRRLGFDYDDVPFEF